MIPETKTDELHPRAVIVTSTGGDLLMVSDQGEVLTKVAVPPGRHNASFYTAMLPPGFSYHLGDGLLAFPPRPRVSVTEGRAFRETDANPDFQPATMSQTEVEARQLLAQMRAASTRQERRFAAMEQALAMRQAAEPAILATNDPVVE